MLQVPNGDGRGVDDMGFSSAGSHARVHLMFDLFILKCPTTITLEYLGVLKNCGFVLIG